MTQLNLTSINIVLDRSGSMTKLTAETITGFNKFLSDQKQVDGEATLTLATFASDYTLVHDFDKLASVSELSLGNYRTGGYTALLDALARTMDATGVKLAAMQEDERPSKVIFVVITDGQENFSREFTREQVLAKINHQREKYGWEFVFLGANQDAIQEGMKLGVTAQNSFTYTADAVGTTSVYNSISSNMSTYRKQSSQNVNFFDQGNGTTAATPTPVVQTPVIIPSK